MDNILTGFLNGDYMPHGHCYLWHPGILWTNVISDFLIALSYFSIPFVLLRIIKRRQDLKFRGIFVLFAAFILLCGITHLFSIYTIWLGAYGIHGVLKAATAIISLATAYVLMVNFSRILSIPSPEQLKEAISQANEEKYKASKLEIQRKADAIFKFATELLPTGLLVINKDKKIILANQALEKMFGYENDMLIQSDLNQLINPETANHHNELVDNYMNKPEQKHAMASGRVVRGKKSNGEEIAVSISLSVHEFEDEKLTFASISDIDRSLRHHADESEVTSRLKRAIHATNLGIWEWNVQSNNVWYSEQLMRLIGQSPEQKGDLKMWQAHIHPEDNEMVTECLNSHFEKGTPYDVEYRGLTETGEYQWLRARGDTLFDSEGKPLLMSGTLANINQRHILEEKLAQRTHFLNEVLEKSLSGLYIFDLAENRNTFINPEYTNITGYTIDDLNALHNSDSLMSLFHPEDLNAILNHIHEVSLNSEKASVGIEYRFKHKNGHWIWLFSHDSVYSFDNLGNPKEMLGAFFEISELKQREIEIKKLALDFYTTFEQAAVGIAHVDLKGRFIKVNSKLAEVLQYTTSELLTLSFQDITYEEDLDKSKEHLVKLLAGEIEQFTTEKRYLTKLNKLIWVNLTVALVRSDNNENSHFISVIEDITHKKQMEFDLEESNASLERFAYTASHDLQEPLRKISAFAGSLNASLGDKLVDKDSKFQLERLVDASSRMSQMIKQLLELSRYSRNKVNKESTRLSIQLSQVEDDLSQLLERKSAQIRLLRDINISVEQHSFQQVLRNLIVNSINYAAKNRAPLIKILGISGPGYDTILVEDNGSGFDSSNAIKIFEPFRRLVGKEISGTGMGLAICRQIINAHDGRISAEGKSGEGAIFKIELPK